MASVRRTHTSISIHAPTRGATNSAALDADAISISIHAPTRGATQMEDFLTDVYKFQSTLPREERQECGGDITDQDKISIHAPTRGATQWRHEPILYG